MFDNIDVLETFTIPQWNVKDFITFCKLYIINGKKDYGFNSPLLFIFYIENNESSFCRICFVGYLLKQNDKISERSAQRILDKLFFNTPPNVHKSSIDYIRLKNNIKCYFEGTIDYEDTKIKENLNNEILRIIKKSVEIMNKEIGEEIEINKKILKGEIRAAVMEGVRNFV